jgi:hypothetical protein
MITLDAPQRTETLKRVTELAPRLSRLSAEIERAQAISADMIALLREAGCLRMTVPRAYGGDGLTLAEPLVPTASNRVPVAVQAALVAAGRPRAAVRRRLRAGSERREHGGGRTAPPRRRRRRPLDVPLVAWTDCRGWP